MFEFDKIDNSWLFKTSDVTRKQDDVGFVSALIQPLLHCNTTDENNPITRSTIVQRKF